MSYFVAADMQQATQKTTHFSEHFAKDLVAGSAGFLLGHCYAMDYIYKNRSYVRERVKLEQEIGFVRQQGSELLEEYPFATQVSLSDAIINRQRLNPVEADEQTQRLQQARVDIVKKRFAEEREK